jgi:hypothetical protein
MQTQMGKNRNRKIEGKKGYRRKGGEGHQRFATDASRADKGNNSRDNRLRYIPATIIRVCFFVLHRGTTLYVLVYISFVEAASRK